MGKFFITPNGHCSVFLRHRPEAQRPANLYVDETRGGHGREAQAAAWLNCVARSEATERRQAAGNVLEPLCFRRQAQSHGRDTRQRRPKFPTSSKPLEGLEPWELAELRYLKDLQNSTISPNFTAGLLDCYLKPQGKGVPELTLAETNSKPASDVQEAATAEDVAPQAVLELLEPSIGKVGKLSVLEAAMAMPMTMPEPRTPPRTPRSPKRRAFSDFGGATPSSPSSRVVPLMLPGMQAVAPAGNSSAASSPKKRESTPTAAPKPGWAGLRKQRLPGQSPSGADGLAAPAEGKRIVGWNSLSPFLKFLKKSPRFGQFGDIDDFQDDGYAFGRSDSDTSSMHAKTAGMMGSLQQWLNANNGQKGQEGGGRDDVATSAEKVEYRGLCILTKKYNMTVSEVRDIKREFNEYDPDGTGQITREEFFTYIRKRTNLPEDEEIPLHLLKSISQGGVRIGFEDFLRWSILTAWSEEMMMPCKEQRKLRQLAREQEMPLPDVEKLKRLFDEFDTDGSGEIEEEEFRHILYKMLQVRDVTDVPLKRLQRYWREVDLDGSGSIGFDEFLIWCRTSFAKDGRVDVI